MKDSVWIPEQEHEERINQYLDRMPPAPYVRIGAIALLVFSLLAAFILTRNF
ncbi:MAG: hypothetical protein HC824_22445 [Synechococcales cyanobacterium RM1_1_8]|nr:hypothetical protein [Synechococcales cyanobacterium RM1_1_8]